MLPWSERPTEVAHLLNPAFLAVLIRDAVKDYQKTDRAAMSYSLPFILLPLVLHRPTREQLPATTATTFHVWLEENAEVRIGFAERAKRLSPFVKEAIMFGLQRGVFQIDEAGDLTDTRKQLRVFSGPEDAEHQQCRKQAKFVGRWFAKFDDPETIYTMWGVRL